MLLSYLPPEALDDGLEQLDRIDVFSFGMTLFELASGQPLPKAGSLEMSRIQHGNLTHIESAVPPFLYDLIHVRLPISAMRQFVLTTLHADHVEPGAFSSLHRRGTGGAHRRRAAAAATRARRGN